MSPLLRLLLSAAVAASVSACGHAVVPGAFSAPGGLAARSLEAHEPGALRLHVLPEAGDKVIVGAIAKARRSVRLQMYLLTHTGVMNALIAAQKRGVDVKVLLEARPYNPGNPSQPLPTNLKAAAYLKKGKVPVHWTSESFRFTHAKAMTIDERVTYVSTANFTKSGLGASAHAAREYIVADSSPSDVAAFVAMFDADLAHLPHQPTDPDLVVSPVNARSGIFELMRSARREVLIAVEVAGDPAFVELLASLKARGVRVRALLGDHDRIGLNLETGKAWAAAGAEVRFQGKPYLHAKSIVVDGRAMYLGSTNLTTNSMDNNRELGLMVNAPAVVSGVLKTCEQDWRRAVPLEKRVEKGEQQLYPGYVFE